VADPTATTLAVRLTSSILAHNASYGLSYNAPSASGLHVYHSTFYDNGLINIAIFNQSNMADLHNNLYYGSAPTAHLFNQDTLTNA
jgi:hypothetical protein